MKPLPIPVLEGQAAEEFLKNIDEPLSKEEVEVIKKAEERFGKNKK